ncbi:3-methyladenine DNA glycosylase [Mycobacteriaceae bacterium 1482268.1]|nr:3-methyladenine DNA glycosylase [Mycobacteriaceae bacterium 1482268.1]
MGATVNETVLAEDDWTKREQTYRQRVERFLAPHVRRAQKGEAHPVWDFLFRYYSLRPRQLRVWHPGFGAVLGGPDGTAARRYLNRTGYGPHPAGVSVTFEYLRSRVDTVGFIAELLRATESRSPRMNCFGMHEWAMVYRAPEVRHVGVPLRLGAEATDAVVESMPLRCTHFDAFRFFTGPAAARNAGAPSRVDQARWEQPGCVHANMDLYKWCYKLGPLIESELLFDALALAAAARELDMRASPYDLVGYGFDPIAIETPAGRAAYVREQQDIAMRAAPLRAVIADRCQQLLAAAMAVAGS